MLNSISNFLSSEILFVCKQQAATWRNSGLWGMSFYTRKPLKAALTTNSITHNALKKNQLSGRSGTDYFFFRSTSINRLCVYCRLVRALCVCHSLKSKCPGDVTAKVVLFKHQKGQTDFFLLNLVRYHFFPLDFLFSLRRGTTEEEASSVGGEKACTR